jgi:hypothetical protein
MTVRYRACGAATGCSSEEAHPAPTVRGLLDTPKPWGPWTTVAYGADFPEWTYAPDPNGASKNRPAWMHTFPAKWISEDGATMWHISDRGDRLNLVRARLRLR